jgi:5-(carboxyamino)imidazole ribonucleotide synthase
VSSPVIGPGSTIGIVGGGQLGRMLAQACHRFGFRVVVFTGGPKDTPAGLVAETEIGAPFDDGDAIVRFVAEADVITWEFENVETAWTVAAEEAGIPVRPSAEVVRTVQDRQLEKQALVALGVPVAPWRPAATAEDLADAVDELGTPVIAKTARWGYDGKGQSRIDHPGSCATAWAELGGVRLVVESVVDLERELSVVAARNEAGAIADHGVMENVHVNHVLDSSVVPARVATAVAAEATAIARTVVEGLDIVGVVCVELFLAGRDLVVNEVAPRPHNSGHCTIEAAAASQFEQQLRAITGLPLGDGECRPAAMVQLLGDLWSEGEPDWAGALVDPGVHLHLYGKTPPRPGRKMGHMTYLCESADVALQRAHAARERVKRR